MFRSEISEHLWSRFSVWAALLIIATVPAFSADLLVWKTNENKVTADIQSAKLQDILARISKITGWQVFVDPDATHTISVKFKDQPQGDALRRLLGNLNFALIPTTNAASKLLVYQNSAQDATQLVEPASTDRASKRIANELIVTLKPGSKESIDDLAKRLGAKVVGRVDETKTYRLQFKDEQSAQSAREALASDSQVGDVDSNYLVEKPTRTDQLQLGTPPPFNLKPKVSNDSSKVIIGLIDTGLQPLGQGMDDFVLPGISVAGESTQNPALPSHGSSMAETILQGLSVNSKEAGGSSVRLLPVDVYGPNEETTTFDVMKGIYAAIDAGATVINLSMGGDGDSRVLANLIQDSHKQGVLFFGAAGNSPSTAPTYPAAYPEVVAVTAGDRKGNLAPYANRGDFVDVMAPGMSVIHHDGQSFMVNGTSTSTAFVSGAAAAHRASGKSASEVETYIRESMAAKLPVKQ